MRILKPVLQILTLGSILLLAACSSQPQRPAPMPTQLPAKLAAEQRYLPNMTPALAAVVKAQPWFENLSRPQLELVAAIQKCEKEALRRGDELSVKGVLEFTAEQGWYQDGLDDRELAGLTGIFDAYARSFEDTYAPPIGPILKPTIELGLFEVVQLPESGQMVLAVAATDYEQGRLALDLTVEALPKVEAIVGKYPYDFLHVQVVPDMPVYLLGVSYNEFIGISSLAIDAGTVIHEVTHSTLFGSFPIWFEEGFAHFAEFYLTDNLEPSVREYTLALQQLRRDPRLDVSARRPQTTQDYLAERARGYLFLKGVYDIKGIEGIKAMIRELRTHTYNDQDLMRAIMSSGPADQSQQMAALVCKGVVGTTRNYCLTP
jgi:hypothetical protein